MAKMELELAPIATPCIGETEAVGLAGQPVPTGSHLLKCKSHYPINLSKIRSKGPKVQ